MQQQNGTVYLIPLLVIIFMDTLGLSLVIPLLNPLLLDSATSFVNGDITQSGRYFLYGLTLGIYSLATFFGAPILGELSDKLGRKRILFLCIMGTFVGYALAIYAVISKLFILFLISRVIDGFTAGSLPIAQAAIVDASHESTKTANIGKILFAASLGYITGPILGGFLSDPHISPWFTLSTPLFVAALLALINGLWLQLMFNETHFVSRPIKIHWLAGLGILRQGFALKSIRQLVILFLLLQLGWAAYSQFAGLFLSSKFHFTSSQIGLFLGLLGLGYGLMFLGLLKPLTQRYSLQRLTLMAFATVSIATLITTLTPNAWGAWLMAIPAAMGLAGGYAVLISRFSDQVDPSKQGRIMGLTGAIAAFSFGVIGLVEGLLTDINTSAPMWTACIGLLLGLLYCLFRRLETPS